MITDIQALGYEIFVLWFVTYLLWIANHKEKL